MSKHPLFLGLFLLFSGLSHASSEAELIKRGEYIARVAGCNDCHTKGYAMSGGSVAKSTWLMGDDLGWQGPWGTTYPANLRIAMSKLTEQQWLELSKTVQYRPPMPWTALRDMETEDLKAIYHFVRSLGPVGEPAPSYLPPGQTANGPVVVFPAPPAKP